jgi:hypothetical protein
MIIPPCFVKEGLSVFVCMIVMMLPVCMGNPPQMLEKMVTPLEFVDPAIIGVTPGVNPHDIRLDIEERGIVQDVEGRRQKLIIFYTKQPGDADADGIGTMGRPAGKKPDTFPPRPWGSHGERGGVPRTIEIVDDIDMTERLKIPEPFAVSMVEEYAKFPLADVPLYRLVGGSLGIGSPDYPDGREDYLFVLLFCL